MAARVAPAARAFALKFLEFINSATCPFTVVKTCVDALTAAGFQQLNEGSTWTAALKPGGAYGCSHFSTAANRNTCCSYYYLRNNSTIIAFRVGANVSWQTGGYKILGAHTDSPCLKLKPMSARNAHGFVQAGVETCVASSSALPPPPTNYRLRLLRVCAP
jgi:aspartyl aminopeptidase